MESLDSEMKFIMIAVSYAILVAVLPAICSAQVYLDHGARSKSLHSNDNTSFKAFYGIPYTYPLGEFRFDTFRNHSSQEPTKKFETSWNVIECLQFRPKSENGNSKTEDCLYLNVFTRKTNPQKVKPVFVVIHGGDFRYGNAHMYDPYLFMDEDIVVVTFNHRLGIFGYLSSGDGYLPGNYGLKDQVRALKWIQTHIFKFGGDPNSVTVFGHGSGAACVHLLTMSSLSKGLFHRVIMHNGNAIQYLQNDSVSNAITVFEKVLEKVKCTRNTTKESVSCLQMQTGAYLNKYGNDLTGEGYFEIPYHPVIEPPNTTDPFLVNPIEYKNSSIPVIIGFDSADMFNKAIDFFNEVEKKEERNEIFDQLDPKSGDRSKAFEIVEKYTGKNNIGDIIRSIWMLRTVLTYPGKTYVYVYNYETNKSSTQAPFINNRNSGFGEADGHEDKVFELFQRKNDIHEKSKDLIKYWVNFMTSENSGQSKNRTIEWKQIELIKSSMVVRLHYMNITRSELKMELKEIYVQQTRSTSSLLGN